MVKSLKEFIGVSGIRVGGLNSVQPMASLSRKGTDTSPKGQGGKGGGSALSSSFSVTTSGEPTTMKPAASISLTAKVKDDKKKK